ncbi:mannitol dehydrogenase family protein [Mycetocola tolaasinivorans]|uniref:Mannitol-1-phosphate 5-dehydrogenase n=1 Tax=Mycetocola tolaasinivorans TaxID=76635 RepID=A0A3L7A055_9MICO|nr:mannitol dehydrogenase family protein [Mycetocola tolaasinivorans]RLP73676.1 mannitol dehydrogenase family protein [Mycetocola tolaasinivorans]
MSNPAAAEVRVPTRTRPHPRIRIAHLGLGAFHRAHQAWYTELVQRAEPGDWGIEAFTGRSPAQAETLAAQDGVYTLVVRAAEGDTFERIESIAAARDGNDTERWRARLADPDTAILSLTITEAGYRRGADGELNLADADVAADLQRLRAGTGEGCVSAPGRIVDGLRARRTAGSGPLAVLSCDNLADNGAVTRAVVGALAARVDPELAAWIEANVSFVSSMVDRITPATTDADRDEAATETGVRDAAVIVTEPFTEWIIAGEFPAGRPSWEHAGARIVDEIEPHERRKLWLLNAGHSLLAYAGLARGHETVDAAFADPVLAERLETLWSEAAAVLPQDAEEIEAARAALRERFANPRIRHHLAQIALGGAHKLPPRIFDVVRARLAAGLDVGTTAGPVVEDWIAYLQRPDTPAAEWAPLGGGVNPDDLTVDALLAILAPDLRSAL